MSSLERIYAKLPVPVQILAVHLEGWRHRRRVFGRYFLERLSDYRAHDALNPDAFEAIREARLRATRRRAAERIPYWRERLASGAPPILSKAEVVALGSRLHDVEAARGAPTAHTSGTTGAGLVFPFPDAARSDQWAVWWRHRMRHGIEPGTWQANLQGRTIVPGVPRRPVYWRVNGPGRQVIYSQYHFAPATERAYLADLERRALPWIQGYPSFVTLVAEAALRHGVKLRPRFVTTGAENLLPHQRHAIREAFGVEPRQHYGQSEAVANFSECPAGRLHVDEDFAAVEFVPVGDGTHRVVGTSFCNDAFPLIRYDTGDLARLDGAGCDCGLPGRIVASIDGRQEDLVELSDGSRVGRLDHLFKDMVRIAEAQIRQPRAGAATIAIVPRPGWSKADERALLDECRERFGERLKVEIDLVEAIPKTASGKLRLVVREGVASSPVRFS